MTKKLIVFVAILVLVLSTVALYFNAFNQKQLVAQKLNQAVAVLIGAQTPPSVEQVSSAVVVEGTSTQEITPTPTVSPTPKPVDPYANDPDLKDAQWGEAVQVSETGYRMKIAYDSVMATADDTFKALNLYRYTKGKSNLTWDGRLANYAYERAKYICENGSDGHAGFSDYIDNQEGYKVLGFYKLGENMSTHMKFTATHLIEWMYAADPAHDGNQLGDWSHVGVGIYDDCSDLIFGNNMI